MKIRIAIAVCACLFILACSQEKSSPPDSSLQTSSVSTRHVRATIYANNFTDATTWQNGILVGGDRKGFYFLVNEGASNPVNVGDRISFKKSGDATVIKADTAIQGSFIAVFVTVDKPLDPNGDGFPNEIQVQ